MTDMTEDFWKLAEENKRLKEEVKRLREQLSKARNWVSDYFTDINGDYMTWEGRDLHADFIRELEG